jgi:hypothetical protein
MVGSSVFAPVLLDNAFFDRLGIENGVPFV